MDRRQVTLIRRVLAPNPGAFTLEGTNTWIVGHAPCLVIDPGPEILEHVDHVMAEAGTIAAILLTHRHADHAAAAARLAERSGAPVLAGVPKGGERGVREGDVVTASPGVRLRVIDTPGHTADHLAFLLPDDGVLFTGDAVLGRGTSVIDPPEGDLAAYLRSLQTMIDLAPRTIHPGHGPVVEDGVEKLREYLHHRLEREQQVLDGLAAGPTTPEELVRRIYVDYPDDLHPAAARSVLAHLLKLEGEGRVARIDPGRDRFALVDAYSPHGHRGGESRM